MTEYNEARSRESSPELSLPWPSYSDFFEVRSSDQNNLFVKCLLCGAANNKMIRTNISSSSNLKKHIKSKHPHSLCALENAKRNEQVKRKLQHSQNNVPNKQTTLERWGTGASHVTQGMLNEAIVNFFVEGCQPLCIVDQPEFINLVRLGLPSSLTIMSSKTLVVRLDEAFTNMVGVLKEELLLLEVVSTTTDMWSKGKRSFIGMTVHWINPESMERKSAALTCKRFIGKHTYDAIAKHLVSVHQEYCIQNKICCTTTDNGSNFCKAFRMFEEVSENDDDTDFQCIGDIMDEHNENILDDDTMILPPHQRCAAHTLNLIAVKDTEQAMEDVSYKKVYRSTFAKCSKLWAKQNQSTQVADHINAKCGVYLKTPVITRWNSTFDSIRQLNTLMETGPEKIDNCMDFCTLPRFTAQELHFIKEYCEVMAPLAQAIDILQSENGMYMGYLLPTLQGIKKRTEKYLFKSLTVCEPLVKSIIGGVQKRFQNNFSSKELIAAACLHPRFKLDWLEEGQKDEAKHHLASFLQRTALECPEGQRHSDEEEEDIFGLNKRSPVEDSGEQELQRFLGCRNKDISSLNDYPQIKKLFIKLNTAMPTSAAAERLFSCASLVLRPNRGNLSDSNFEKQLLLKINKQWLKKW